MGSGYWKATKGLQESAAAKLAAQSSAGKEFQAQIVFGVSAVTAVAPLEAAEVEQS